MPLHPITPSSLLDSVTWSISEPTSSAGIYTDTARTDDIFQAERTQRSVNEVSFDNLSRPLKERSLTTLFLQLLPQILLSYPYTVRYSIHFEFWAILLFTVRRLKLFWKVTFSPSYFQSTDLVSWDHLLGLFSKKRGLHVWKFWILSIIFIRYAKYYPSYYIHTGKFW